MKRIVKSTLLKISSFIEKNKDSKVIYYHDVHDNKPITNMSTDITLFLNHVELVRNEKYNIVQSINQKKNQIKICFDDGFKGIYTCKEYFIKNKIPVEVFLISSYIGKEGYLSKEDILELKNTGFFSFGAHTHTHVNLGDIPDVEVENELKISKQIIESIILEPVKSICFPRGIFSDKVVEISKRLGYENLYSSLPGSFFCANMPEVICRYLVQHTPKKMMKNVLNGGQNIFYKKILKQHYRV